MSSESGNSYGMHCATMETDKHWIDASVLHALGCIFRVDVALFQEGADPMIVGHSLLRPSGGSPMAETLDMVPLAMVNDFHYWGIETAPSDDCGDLCLEHGGEVCLPQSSHASAKRPRSLISGGLDDEADDDVWHPASVSPASKPMDSADVEAELMFCKVLMHWSPWDAPSAAHRSRIGPA